MRYVPDSIRRSTIQPLKYSHTNLCHHNDQVTMLKDSFQYSSCIGNRLFKERVKSGNNRFPDHMQELSDVLALFSTVNTILMLQVHNINVRSIEVLRTLS